MPALGISGCRCSQLNPVKMQLLRRRWAIDCSCTDFVSSSVCLLRYRVDSLCASAPGWERSSIGSTLAIDALRC